MLKHDRVRIRHMLDAARVEALKIVDGLGNSAKCKVMGSVNGPIYVVGTVWISAR